jgi:hypothetical protein
VSNGAFGKGKGKCVIPPHFNARERREHRRTDKVRMLFTLFHKYNALTQKRKRLWQRITDLGQG